MSTPNDGTPLNILRELRTPETLLALAERYNEVELYEHVATSAMMTALSTDELPNGEREDLIHKFWQFADDRFTALQTSPTLGEQARKAQTYLDVFARACLNMLGHYEYFDRSDPDRALRELGNRLSRGW